MCASRGCGEDRKQLSARGHSLPDSAHLSCWSQGMADHHIRRGCENSRYRKQLSACKHGSRQALGPRLVRVETTKPPHFVTIYPGGRNAKLEDSDRTGISCTGGALLAFALARFLAGLPDCVYSPAKRVVLMPFWGSRLYPQLAHLIPETAERIPLPPTKAVSRLTRSHCSCWA